jgi:hypothetical protein
MRWIDRQREVIQADVVIPKRFKGVYAGPLYKEMDEYYRHEELKKKISLQSKRGEPKHKSYIGIANHVAQIYEHYCGGEPRCIICGETDKQVLQLHHVNRRKYPYKWADIVAEGFPDNWIMPLCANHHSKEHRKSTAWKQKVYR